MAPSFILISANDKLNYLVDGIEKCRPLNDSYPVNISTGKIIPQDGKLYYRYRISSDISDGTHEKNLSDLLTNQIASFRLTYNIPKGQLLPVFLLENPQTEKDEIMSKLFIDAFETIYKQTHINKFILYRVVFSYDIENPVNVVSPNNSTLLSKIIEEHRQKTTDYDRFSQYIIYIDNQAADASICSNKEDHDFFIPRFLADLTMLISSGKIQNINHTMNIFSAGYGECFYYYPDIERFFRLDDKRELYNIILNDPDDKTLSYNEGFDIDKHFIGLTERYKEYSAIFEDVPFDDNITDHKNTADAIIDHNIQLLKGALDKRLKEIKEAYLHSDEINLINEQIEKLSELDEDVSERIKNLIEQKKKLIEENCPEYIDRENIFKSLLTIPEDKKFDFINSKQKKYTQLLRYILSPEFQEYIDSLTESTDDSNSDNPGCLFAILSIFGHKDTEKGTKETTPWLDYINNISQQLELKEKYKRFKKRYVKIKSDYNDFCISVKRFSLTTHSHSSHPMIDIDKLKSYHGNGLYAAVQDYINKYKEDNTETTISGLENFIENCKSNIETEQYKYINWNNIPKFIINILDSTVFQGITNNIVSKSTPFLNYSVTDNISHERISLFLYSDIKDPAIGDISNIFNKYKSNINNSDYIGTTFSDYIESKICMIQFLPFDESILKGLTDLSGNTNDTTIELIRQNDDITETDSNNTDLTKNDADTAETTIGTGEKKLDAKFWGTAKMSPDYASKEKKCYLCHSTISGTYFFDWAGHCVCEKHKESLVQCASCFQYCNDSSKDVGAGQKICSHCQKYRVEKDDFDKITNFIQDYYAQQVIGRVLNWKLCMVSPEKLFEMTGNKNTRGLAKAVGEEYTIYIYRELSRVSFAKTLAHEMLHIYQYTNDINSSHTEKVEGFCNIGSYEILKLINNAEAKAAMNNLLESSDPIYGDGFRYMLKIYQDGGWNAVIDELRKE